MGENTHQGKALKKEIDPLAVYFNDRQVNSENFFRNARIVLKKDEMTTLRESIRTLGLLKPIIVRPYKEPDKYELIAGSRRLRSILKLIELNSECFNSKNGNMELAETVYKPMEMVVYDCDDIGAIKISISENLEHSQVPEIDLMEYCTELSTVCDKLGNLIFTRDQIAEMCNRSTSWVSNTLKLASLPTEIRELIASGRMTRTAALSFLQTRPNKLEEVVNQAKNLIKDSAKQEENEAEVELNSAIEEKENNEIALIYASAIGDESIPQLQKKIINAQKKVSSASEKKIVAVKKAEEGILSAAVIDKANIMVPGAKKGAPKPVPTTTIRKVYENFLNDPRCKENLSSDKKLALSCVKSVFEYVLGRKVVDDAYTLATQEIDKLSSDDSGSLELLVVV